MESVTHMNYYFLGDSYYVARNFETSPNFGSKKQICLSNRCVFLQLKLLKYSENFCFYRFIESKKNVENWVFWLSDIELMVSSTESTKILNFPSFFPTFYFRLESADFAGRRWGNN